MKPEKPDTLDLRYPRVKEGVKEGDYVLPGRCNNCGWEGTLLLSQGFEAPSYPPYYRAATCKRCGCKTVGAKR